MAKKKSQPKKIVTLSEEDVYQLHEKIRRTKQTNILLLELLEETLEMNARLAQIVQEAYHQLPKADRAEKVLTAILGQYEEKKEETESVGMA